MRIYSGVGKFGVMTRQELLASGRSRAEIQLATSSGLLERLDRTRFALPGADPQVVTAARMGATLTCLSALRLHGVETSPGRTPHIRRHRYANNTRPPNPGLSCPLPGFEVSCVVDPLDKALLAALRNHEPETAIALLDSILHLGLRTRAELEPVVHEAGKYAVALLGRADSRSESPLESIVRHRLQALGIRFDVQVDLPGIGRVDFLIGKRLIIETDGRRYHDPSFGDAAGQAFENDRVRDAGAAAQGYLVIRLSWKQVMNNWAQVIARILVIIRGDAHRRPPNRMVTHEGSTKEHTLTEDIPVEAAGQLSA